MVSSQHKIDGAENCVAYPTYRRRTLKAGGVSVVTESGCGFGFKMMCCFKNVLLGSWPALSVQCLWSLDMLVRALLSRSLHTRRQKWMLYEGTVIDALGFICNFILSSWISGCPVKHSWVLPVCSELWDQQLWEHSRCCGSGCGPVLRLSAGLHRAVHLPWIRPASCSHCPSEVGPTDYHSTVQVANAGKKDVNALCSLLS